MIKKERMLHDVINIGPIFEWFAYASMVCWENLPFLETLQTMVDKINFYIFHYISLYLIVFLNLSIPQRKRKNWYSLVHVKPSKTFVGPQRTMAKIGALIQRMVTAEENRGYSVPLRGLPYV